ncbi:Aspartate ammonia-lyase [Paramyrothecium foliicola]|nr:Aspartate ammonia-lyase [Paramyrothecium foliicola]
MARSQNPKNLVPLVPMPTEKDSLGQLELSANDLYGINTERAANLPFSGRPLPYSRAVSDAGLGWDGDWNRLWIEARLQSSRLPLSPAIMGVQVSLGGDSFEAMQNMGTHTRLSVELRDTAYIFSKVSTDLITLSSGFGCGFGEIVLPTVQARSTIIPSMVLPPIFAGNFLNPDQAALNDFMNGPRNMAVSTIPMKGDLVR